MPWTQTLIITLTKKGNLQLCQNHQPHQPPEQSCADNLAEPTEGTSQDNPAGHSARREKKRQTERDGRTKSRNGLA